MNYWKVQESLNAVLNGDVNDAPVRSSYWDTVEAVNTVMANDIGDTKSWGMHKFLQEGVVAKIQKAVMDFLSAEFRSIPKDEIADELLDKPNHYAERWLKMAKLHGLNSQGAQRLGWKYIRTGEFTELPGMDRYV